MMYFLRGSLPWQGLKAATKKQKYERISEKKMSTSIEELCKGFPSEFTTYLNFCRSLRFEDKPDYAYLRQLFRNLFHRHGFTYDYVFDWNLLNLQGGHPLEDPASLGRRDRQYMPGAPQSRGLPLPSRPLVGSSGMEQLGMMVAPPTPPVVMHAMEYSSSNSHIPLPLSSSTRLRTDHMNRLPPSPAAGILNHNTGGPGSASHGRPPQSRPILSNGGTPGGPAPPFIYMPYAPQPQRTPATADDQLRLREVSMGAARSASRNHRSDVPSSSMV